jgi:hypothetical protein
VEAMYQFGRFGNGEIQAWRAVAESSHVFQSAWRSRIGLILDVASGDHDRESANLGTFNALFQSGAYSGRAGLLGPNNSIRLEPSVAFAPDRNVAVSGGWGFYWRESVHDGLYGLSGQLIVPSNGVPGRYEGSRPIAQVDWTLTRHLSAHVNYIFVFNAEFEQRSVHGTPTMTYVTSWITYRF